MFSAWAGGTRAGLFAVALSLLCFVYYFVAPTHSLIIHSDQIVRTVIFVLSALFVWVLSARQRSTTESLVVAREHLTRAVQELGRINAALQAENAERKRAEEAVGKQARLLDLTHDSIFVRDMDDVITYWNRGAEELYGWKCDQALGKVSHQLTQTIFPAPLNEINAELLSTGRWEGELVHARRQGAPVVVASRWSLQRDDLGRPVAILETNNDITDRKRAEERFAQAEKELRATIDTIPALVTRASPDGTVDFVNARWAEQGFSEHDMQSLSALGHPDDLAETAELRSRSLATGEPYEIEARLRRANGEYRWYLIRAVALRDDAGEVVKRYSTATDIEDRKRAEDALHKTQADLAHVTRVTTLGELAASIAHEVNQPLAAVVTNGEVGLRWLDRGVPNLAEVRDALKGVISSGRRASEIIERLRALSRKTEPQRVAFDINDAISEVIPLVQHQMLNHRVSLRLELMSTQPAVLGDRVQLQQVIINLIVNGMEAMETVTDRPRELVVRSQLDDSGQVLVAVEDSGVGIEPENAKQLFNPFFTTKPSGMGMGLSICRSIIEDHGGNLWASPNTGPGATFQFALQLHQEARP
jgi:PAS domain S-box-containing protein